MRTIQAGLIALLVAAGGVTMATEEAKFSLVKKDGALELREYEARVVAETRVDGSFEQAGNTAFQRLFDYISGQNSSRQKIAMTAPVTQETSSSEPAVPGEKIAMTAPVTQEKAGEGYRVTFVLPATYTIENAPVPTNPEVKLVHEPAHQAAAIRYSGSWSTKLYEKNLTRLNEWVTSQSLSPAGPPVWARYNAPFSLPMFRRNEVIIPVTPQP